MSACALVAAICFSPRAAQGDGEPVPLVFDTDLGNDVDDILALTMIHALQDRGECELLAVTTTKDHPLAAPFVDAVNTFYGRGDVPIGVCRSDVTPAQGKFLGMVEERTEEGFTYPHDLPPAEELPSAVTVLRGTLAGASDNSVVIVQVGFSTNLAALLESQGDEISPLSGKELVKRKVRLLSLMAGAFEPIRNREGQLTEYREYNVVKDIAAAQRVAEDWPTDVVWSGYEIGIAACFPHQSIDNDFRYARPHIAVEAYKKYCPPGHDRPTWDLTSVLYAVRPDRNYFTLSPAGLVHVANNGLTTFEPSEAGNHRFLKLVGSDHGRLVATLVALASQPPVNRGTCP